MRNYWLCPLYNFDCSSKSINFERGLNIKPTWPDLNEELLLYYPDWSDVESSKFMVLLPQEEQFALETNIVTKINKIIEIHQKLSNFFTALRLYHTGNIVPGPLISATENIEPTSNDRYTFDIHGWQNIPTEFGYLYGFVDLSKFQFNVKNTKLIYHLNKSDIPLIKTILRNLYFCIEKQHINETLRRFNASYYNNLEDRLIDQMIAFESLYIGDDKELGYKLAIRAAFFLGNGIERKSIFNHMKRAYNFRGVAVHGGEYKDKDLNELQEITTINEEYLRCSIKKFLLLLIKGYSLDKLKKGGKGTLAKLDENIITNSKTLTIP